MVAKDPLLTSLSLQWLFLCGLFQFRSCQGFSGEMTLASPLLCTACGILLNLEQVILLSSPTEWPLLAPLARRPYLRPAGCSAAMLSGVGRMAHAKASPQAGSAAAWSSNRSSRQDFSATCGSQCLKVLMTVVEG